MASASSKPEREKQQALVLNTRMTNIHYAVYELEWQDEEITTKKRCGGCVEGIGRSCPRFIIEDENGRKRALDEAIDALCDHSSALDAIFLQVVRTGLRLNVIGHRVVHGGSNYTESVVVDDEVLIAISKYANLAPLHNPPALLGLRSAIGAYPDIKQVVCFDTSFHADIQPENYRYALPEKFYKEHGIRRYGFHGSSYASLTQKVTKRFFGGDATGRTYILMYLGDSGASMSCLRDGKCIDTTMGFTPLEGLTMATRCGDIDPGILPFMHRELKLSPAEIEDILNTQSGVLALSGNASSDMLTLAKTHDPKARLARKIYIESIRKYLGAYLVKLEGKCNAIVFTARVGEQDAALRAEVCRGLEALGIQLDDALNTNLNTTQNLCTDIATTFSETRIIVSTSDQEAYIARQAASLGGLFAEEAEAARQSRAQHNKLALLNRRNSKGQIEYHDLRLRKAEDIRIGKVPELGTAVYIDGVGSTWREECGLLFQVLPHAPRLGYFRPFADDDDRKMRAMREVFQLDHKQSYNKARGATRQQANDMLAKGDEDELLDLVVEKFLSYSADKDFVLVSRASLGKHRQGDAFWTAKFAAALMLPVIYVTHEASSGAVLVKPMAPYLAQLSEVSNRVKQALEARGGRLAGIITTLPSARSKESDQTIDRESVVTTCESIGVYPAALLENDPLYSSTSVAEVAEALSAAVLIGNPDVLASSQVHGVVVATRFVAEIIEMLRQAPAGQLLVTHADRVDIILAVAMAQLSSEFPHLAGILVTGYRTAASPTLLGRRQRSMSYPPLTDTPATDEFSDAYFQGPVRTDEDENAALNRVLAILHSVPKNVHLPCIIAVAHSTYAAVSAVTSISPAMLPESCDKIEAAQLLFERHLDPDFRSALLAEVLERKKNQGANGIFSPKSGLCTTKTTPKIFQHELYTRARSDTMTIVLPEGDDRRILEAASKVVQRKLAKIILLGNEQDLRAKAKEMRLDATLFGPDTEIYDPQADHDPDGLRAVMANALYECRKHKGVTQEGALSLIRNDPNYYGTMLLQLGLADGMVSGACHSTAATMRPPLQIIKMKPGVPIVSSIFFMLLQDGVKCFGDAAINVNPTANELAIIATASAHTARAFGLEPRVALLSYATGDSNTGALIDKVRNATTKARELCPDDLFEGPIQFDAAVDPAVAKVKYKGGENLVAGKANVCIFPTLDSGNSAYKAVQQASKCVAIGPVMQGMRKPVNDLSRGCTVNDIVNTIVVTAVQAQQEAADAAS